MTCRGDAAATDWLLFGGGRASVRFRPPFLCPGQSRDGGPGQNSKRGAGRVSGQDGGGGADCGRPGQNSKRSAGRVGAPGRAGEHAQAVRRFGVVMLRAELQKGRGPWRHFRPSGRGGGPCGASVSEGGDSEVGKVRVGVAGGSRSGGGEVRVGVAGCGSSGAGTARIGEARIGAARVGEARIGETVDWIRVGRGDVGGAGMIKTPAFPEGRRAFPVGARGRYLPM